MKVVAIVGSSSLEKAGLVEGLIEALRLDGFSVSVVKRAPDGFDIDRPGKGSYLRRQAGAREVMMASPERFVLMRESRDGGEPDLASLIARLEPVDIVIAEGFHEVDAPTIEAMRPSRGKRPRWPNDRRIVAIVSDERVDAPLPTFTLDDPGALAQFIEERLGLRAATR
jgi:molybdopterin-guanine dinucleotide biosynthesis adapter protein